MNEDLLLEIGTEEIPAGYISPALEQLKNLTKGLLEEERLVHKGIQTFGTPRRLVLYVEGVVLHQQDLITEIMGPPRHISFDSEGKPTQAAIGFARVQGVRVEELQTRQTPKGDYILAIKTLQGKETKEVLTTVLPKIITSISFPKSMYWQSKSLNEVSLYFARPIRWILALLGETKIEFELAGIKSANHTCGHRFLSKQPIKINHPAEYEEKLRENYVMVNQVKRQEMIMEAINSYCEKNGCVAPETEELLEEVVYLVEYPCLIVGGFDKEYLKLPHEVLVAAMRGHQRYFHITNKDGKFLPNFLVIANTNPEVAPANTINTIREGNERVLKARLADAAFFFTQDKRISLEARVEQEKGRVWQEDLGTVYEKTQRVVKLAEFIAGKIALEFIPKAGRAALLCKADLSTEMVGEFTNLQGIMGYYYALADGEDKDVANAIREHYLPTSAEGVLPQTLVSAIVSIADKIDSIVGCFSVGLIPTGSQDPYALRRQAQGIINILSAGFFKIPSTPSIPPLSLQELVDYSLNLLAEKTKRERKTVEDDVLNFLTQRLQNLLINGIRMGTFSQPGIVDASQSQALLAVGVDDIPDVLQRAHALSEFAGTNEFEPLIIAFKRVVNILKAEGCRLKVEGRRQEAGDRRQETEVRKELFVEEGEINLYTVYVKLKEELHLHLVKKDYPNYLSTLARFRQPIDNFFDKVMVMAEDKDLRENRLALLDNIAGLFLKIAKF
ncbi:MAG: glycine--tRNA ligase subunit beta [Nitrospirota bacterium]